MYEHLLCILIPLSFMWYPTVARRFRCTLLTVMQIWPTSATALDIMFKAFFTSIYVQMLHFFVW